MAALYKLQRRLALADAAVADEQQTLAVDLDEHAVRRQARGKVLAQGGDDVGLKLRGVLMRDEHIAVVLLSHFYALREGRHTVADHKSRDIVLHEALERGAALLGRKRIKICALDAPHDLQALRVEVIIEAGELHSRAVYIGSRQQRGLIVL